MEQEQISNAGGDRNNENGKPKVVHDFLQNERKEILSVVCHSSSLFE